MSENLEDNEPRIIPPAVGNTQNEQVEPLIGTGHAPREARTVASDPEETGVAKIIESWFTTSKAGPIHPAPKGLTM